MSYAEQLLELAAQPHDADAVAVIDRGTARWATRDEALDLVVGLLPFPLDVRFFLALHEWRPAPGYVFALVADNLDGAGLFFVDTEAGDVIPTARGMCA